MADRYNHASHWVSRIIDTDWPISIDSPVLASILWFGTLPNVFFLYLVVFQSRQIPADFVYPLFFAVLWLNLGPLLIRYYDERLLPTFFEELTELLANEERVDDLNRKYDALFSELYWIPTLVWVALLLGLFFRAQPSLVEEGLFEVGDAFYFIYLFSTGWLGVFTGIGFMGVITTVLAIREISNERLNINPLHPDGLGGLGIVGYYAIRTTLTFSTGSLLLPLSFIFVRMSLVDLLIYVIVALYMGAIAVSFLYPTYKINRQAQRIRDETLDALRRKYNRSTHGVKTTDPSAVPSTDEPTFRLPLPDDASDLDDRPTTVMLASQLELQRLRNEYEDYRSVRLYPFQIDILLKLVSSILLPLIFMVIDSHIKSVI